MYEEFVKEFQIVELSDYEKDSELINNINNVKRSLSNMYKNIQFADSDLIDYYSYMIKAEEAKYSYLLKQAKKRKINLIN